MPSTSALPAKTWANSGDATSASSMPSKAATSCEYAMSRGAATRVGWTREYKAPCTCRRRVPVSGSAGSLDTKALSKRKACIRRGSEPSVFMLLSGKRRARHRAAKKKQGDRHGNQIPQDAVDECRAIGAGMVEYGAGHPSSQGHAEQRGRDDRADPRARLPRRKILAHDDRIGRHDASLEQPEQRRDDVERDQSVEGQEHDQRGELEPRTEKERAQATDAVADETEAEPADDAAPEHQRQHLRAARRTVSQVAAVSDQVHLGHRHRDAAG